MLKLKRKKKNQRSIIQIQYITFLFIFYFSNLLKQKNSPRLYYVIKTTGNCHFEECIVIYFHYLINDNNVVVGLLAIQIQVID